jgi:hypothetical protein
MNFSWVDLILSFILGVIIGFILGSEKVEKIEPG